METNERYFSFKKNPKKEVTYGLILISCVSLICLLSYFLFENLIFDKFKDMQLFDTTSNYWSNTTRVFSLIIFVISLAIILIVVYLLIRLLFKGIKLIFQREKVILAKVNKMSVEILGEIEDTIDSPNSSFSKSLAKLFKHVTIHQKARDGKIESIYFYVSQIKSFSYPSAKMIFDQLAGVCEPLGIEVSLFAKSDFSDYSKDFSEQYGNPIPYQMRGIVLSGEPAYQHVKKFTAPIDALVETIVSKSKGVEIHTFNSIRQGSSFRFWLRKRTLPRTKTKDGKDRELSKKELHKISETEDMSTSGYVYGEVAVLIKGINKRNLDEIENKMLGSLETIYDGFTRKITVDKIHYKKLLRKIRNHELVASNHSLISGLSARAIIDVYRKPMSGIPINKDLTTPPSVKRPPETHPIVLGETITGELVRVRKEDYLHHRAVFGATGYGKSSLIRAELEQMDEHYPEIKKIVISFADEYAKAFVGNPKYTIWEANSELAPLHINPFQDSFVNRNEHSEFLFKYFNEMFENEAVYRDYTPQQKAVLKGAIQLTIQNTELTERNYPTFLGNTEQYVELNKDRLITGQWSYKSIINKLSLFENELRNIVWANSSNLTMDMIEDSNIILNLQSVSNNDAKRAIVNLLLYQLRNYVLKTKPTGLKIHVYIEEAQIVAPEKERRKSSADMMFVEECLTEIRKHGVAISLIGTSVENITRFALESKFLVNFSYISRALCDKMNYTHVKDIHSLKKYQCDVKLPNEEFPIRLVKLARPRNEPLSEDDYQTVLATDSRYENIRNLSYLLESSTDLEEMIDERRRIDTATQLMTGCLSNCEFYYTEAKECHLAKRKNNRITNLIKDVADEIVHDVCEGWDGVQKKFDSDFDFIMKESSELIHFHMPEKAKIRMKIVSDDDKEKLRKCVLIRLLRGLTNNDLIMLIQAEGYLVDYVTYKNSHSTSPYGFDEDDIENDWEIDDYENYWEED